MNNCAASVILIGNIWKWIYVVLWYLVITVSATDRNPGHIPGPVPEQEQSRNKSGPADFFVAGPVLSGPEIF